MYQLGTDPEHAREMDLDDILLRRVALLMVMAGDYLNGATIGRHQRQAMVSNAQHVEAECDIACEPSIWESSRRHIQNGNYLCQRLKLLSMMVAAVARGNAIEGYRKKAMREIMATTNELMRDGEPAADDAVCLRKRNSYAYSRHTLPSRIDSRLAERVPANPNYSASR